jgi:hypothetical protein
MDRIAQIIKLEAEADTADGQAKAATEEAELLRWETARLISEELATGTSQRRLAEQVGLSQPTIFRRKEAWKRYGNVSADERPKFSAACEEANPQGHSPVRIAARAAVASEDNSGGWQPRKSATREGEEPDEEAGSATAAALILQMDETLHQLETMPASWRFLEADDIEVLKSVPNRVRDVVQRIYDRLAS